MLFCSPSGLSQALSGCPHPSVHQARLRPSVLLFPVFAVSFPYGSASAFVRQPQPGCFRPCVCLCQSPSVLSPCPGVSCPCVLPCSSSRIAWPRPRPAGPCPAALRSLCLLLLCPSWSVLLLGPCPSVLAYLVLGVPCLSPSWSLGVPSPSLSWFPEVSCLVLVSGCPLSVPIPDPKCPLLGPGPLVSWSFGVHL